MSPYFAPGMVLSSSAAKAHLLLTIAVCDAVTITPTLQKMNPGCRDVKQPAQGQVAGQWPHRTWTVWLKASSSGKQPADAFSIWGKAVFWSGFKAAPAFPSWDAGRLLTSSDKSRCWEQMGGAGRRAGRLCLNAILPRSIDFHCLYSNCPNSNKSNDDIINI